MKRRSVNPAPVLGQPGVLGGHRFGRVIGDPVDPDRPLEGAPVDEEADQLLVARARGLGGERAGDREPERDRDRHDPSDAREPAAGHGRYPVPGEARRASRSR